MEFSHGLPNILNVALSFGYTISHGLLNILNVGSSFGYTISLLFSTKMAEIFTSHIFLSAKNMEQANLNKFAAFCILRLVSNHI